MENEEILKTLEHCISGRPCRKCAYGTMETVLSCPGLLKAVYKQMKYYEDLRSRGGMAVLPCAVGDTVYTNCSVQGWRFRKDSRPYKAKVVFIGINGVDNIMNADFGNGHMLQFRFSDIGRTVFLTKEEA